MLQKLRTALLCTLTLCAALAHAATLNVGPGQPYTTIQSAINAAHDFDTVLVAPGTYTENIDFLGKWIAVTSSGGPTVTIIDGSAKSAPAVTIESGGTHTAVMGAPTFSGFTVQNGGTGAAAVPTGGIYVNLSNGTISNNVLTHNHCAGLWVVMLESPPTVQNNEVDSTTDNFDCPTGGGSGIVVSRIGSGCVNCTNIPVILNGNTVQDNLQGGHEGQGGGGITILGGVPGAQIQNNTVAGNASAGIGGGIFLAISNAEVVQNLVYNNQAICGGAAIATERASTTAGTGTLLLANNTLYNDTLTGASCTASQAGNGSELLFGDEGSLTYPAVVVNNILSGNSSQPILACAFVNDAAAGLSDTPVFDHNLFFNAFFKVSGRIIDTVSCADPNALLGDLSSNPQLMNPAAYNFQLQSTSPAIDAGNTSALALDNYSIYFTINTTTDFGGNPRLADATGKGYATIDMGAYEFTGTADTQQTNVSLSVSNVSGEVFLLTAQGGSSVNLSAYVTSPQGGTSGCTGPVTFLEDGSSIGTASVVAYTNTATLKGVFLAPGTHHFAASYGGQSPCSTGVSVPIIYIVSNYTPSLTLTSSLNPALLTQPVTFTTTIASADPAQGGPITLTDGSTTLTTLTPNPSGLATFTTSSLALGAHAIQASYAANSTHNAASSSLTQYIVGGNITTTTMLASSENPAALGDTVTFTATVTSVSGTPTGSVKFAEGTTVYAIVPLNASGIAQWSTSTLAAGSHTITATFVPILFVPPSLYRESTASFTEFIVPGTATTLKITAAGAAVASVSSGTAVTLTATVASSGAAVTPGQVTFCDATANFCTDIHLLGTAQLTTAGTATLKFVPGPGSHSYYAAFLGTNAFAASASTNVPLKVVAVKGPVKTTVGIQSSGGPGDYALLGTVATNGTASPTGTISFLDTSNANYVLGSATLGPTGSKGISFLNTTTFPLQRLNNVVGSVVAAGDFNGDGIPDILVTDPSISALYILLGKGDGTFTSSSILGPTGQSLGKIVTGDFNGDDKLDFALANNTGFQIYLGNGDGTFTLGQALNLPQYSQSGTGGFVAADFNGDGILDLAQELNTGAPGSSGGNCFTGYENCTLQVYLGKGDGTFTALSTTTPSNFAASMVVADFNGDGKPDIALASYVDLSVLVLLGKGDGTFVAAPYALAGSQNIALAAADVNGDGSPDLVVETQNPSSAITLLGNGDGTFAALPTNSNLAQQADSLAIGDFNGDGVPDLVQPNQNGGYTSVFLGKGDGTFVPDAFSPSVANFIFTSIAIADFNGDGQSDIATATFNNDSSNSLPDQLDVLLAQSPSTAAAYIYNISPVGTGLHYVDASYPGDSNNIAGLSTPIPLVAEQVTTALTLSANPSPSVVGQAVVLTAALSPFSAQNHSASGNVTFIGSGSTLGIAPVNNGVATLTTSALSLGTDNLIAKYPGDTNFTSSVSKVLPLVIANPATALTLTSSQNPAPALAPITFTAHLVSGGQPVSNAAVNLIYNPTGTAQVVVPLTTDANGNASFTTSALAPGSYAIAATYAATTNYLASSAALTQVVTAIPTATTLTASPNPAYIGQAVTLTATVSGGATGSVTFFDGSSPLTTIALTSGTATFITSTLAVGTHPLTASYAATTVYLASTSPIVNEVILPSGFTIALTPTTITLPPGQTGTVAILLTSVGNFSGPLALTYGQLPTYATAAINPTTVTLTGGGTGASTLTLNTAAKAANAIPTRPGSRNALPIALAAALLGFIARRRRRVLYSLSSIALVLCLASLTGCTNDWYKLNVVAPGSYTVAVTATDVNHNTQTATVTVVVTP